MGSILCGAVVVLALGAEGPHAAMDWPMLAHDAARSGATMGEIRPPFARKWYRLFPDEGLMTGVQPVVASGKVFVGTLAGTLHAIDEASGKDAWVFQAGGSILHTCAAAEGKVFFGAADGKVYAVKIDDGALAWSVPTGAAVWNAPLVHNGTMVIGSRDGKLCAIDAGTGAVRWQSQTNGPLLNSPALDAKSGRLYVGSEDMHVYAFAVGDGKLLWKSEKLPGVSFRGYHPVIAPDGSVMITVTPALSLDAILVVLEDMAKSVFGDYASWRHKKEENDRLRAQNFELMRKPETYESQLRYLRQRLGDEPFYQTFFVLDPASGKQKYVTPIVYAESMNGTGAPAVVAPNGKVIVKYQALLRSRYEHYSPFLNVGYLDTATGHIEPIMDQSRTYGWHDSLLLVHDEQCQLSVAGRVLINTHQDNVNAMDLDTLSGYGAPFCRNIHEPQPGEAMGIWARLLRGESIPEGKEWLARGTAVYGGGSVIDMPVSIAGHSFYFLPTHEINCGAAVIACKMQPGGTAGEESRPPRERLSPGEWQQIQQRRWDWDMLATPRLRSVLNDLPGKMPGTREQPLSKEAAEAVGRISDSDLDRVIWEAPVISAGQPGPPDARRETLGQSIRELISQAWRPLVFPSGKHPTEAYRFFVEPTETLFTLARAYPYLDAGLQHEVRQYVARMAAPNGPLAGPTGQARYEHDRGAVRSSYEAPSGPPMKIVDDMTRNAVARLYPLWLWAHVTGDWTKIERDWKTLRELVDQAPNAMDEDCRNGHLAGLIAFCRLAYHVQDNAAVERGLAASRKLARERLVYEISHARGGVMTPVPVGRSVLARWRNLTPEVGRLCAKHAGQIERQLMDVYVDYHRPTWWLAWNVELLWRNESPMSLPTMSAEIFAARSLILHEPPEKLSSYLDVPWCKADLFFIQKQVHCLEASREPGWKDVRQP